MASDGAIQTILQKRREVLHPGLPFDAAKDRLCRLDFTEKNKELRPEQVADTESFAHYINGVLRQQGARYGIGGYGEHRTLYARSRHFDQSLTNPGSEAIRAVPAAAKGEAAPEPRRLHLGVDIWGPAGTKVMAPLDALIHSFAFNNNDSDYGATLILTHNLEGVGFNSLYGHLSLNSLKNCYEGRTIRKGDVIGEFGMRFENGNWPPHLHLQLIADMQGWKGDYPGVCKFSEKAQWLANCPDPDLLLRLMRYVN